MHLHPSRLAIAAKARPCGSSRAAGGEPASLSRRIDANADVHDRLPGRLAVVAGGAGGTVADPATGQPYQYETTGERSYRLCATFETAQDAAPIPDVHLDQWRHGDGRQCFDREVEEVVRPGVPVRAPR